MEIPEKNIKKLSKSELEIRVNVLRNYTDEIAEKIIEFEQRFDLTGDISFKAAIDNLYTPAIQTAKKYLGLYEQLLI